MVMVYDRGGQIEARRTVFSGLQKHAGPPSIWNILQIITVNISAEANLKHDLLPFTSEGMALRYTWHYQSGPRAKLIVHAWSIICFCSDVALLHRILVICHCR